MYDIRLEIEMKMPKQLHRSGVFVDNIEHLVADFEVGTE